MSPHPYISFSNTTRTVVRCQKNLTSLYSHIVPGEKAEPGLQLDVIFCGRKKIHSLNAAFRHKDQPTDVLSFPYHEPDFLGEIYICLPIAAAQAQAYGFSLNEELQRLFVHGVIHLLGHDHQTLPQRARMERIERKYCPFLAS